ncbi:MAG: polyprenyl glycosylphosphotransferase [Acidobacteria bacterium]|nr:MAG: polyprenyl glycosylphosphotransferase [Acidobacteriota bacterium]
MVRLFHVYYPVRTLVLLAGEAVAVCLSFLAATLIQFGPDSYLVLNYEEGLYKILAIAVLVLICSYYFDLYAPQLPLSGGETSFRLLLVLGTSSFLLAAIGFYFPEFMLGKRADLFGVVILTGTLLLWRGAYSWLLRRPFLSERVYVLGSGDRARRVVDEIRTRKDLGMEVVGWAGAFGNGGSDREDLAETVRGLVGKSNVDRVVVALSDRRNTLPVRELLDLRLEAIQIEDVSSLLEKISGKIEIENLYPSSLIYSEGFRLGSGFLFVRRCVSFVIAAVALLLCLPVIPIIALAVKFSSDGPILFRQQRVGRRGEAFVLYKFRTMRQDAEAQTGAVWAGKDDPRVTGVGKFLRATRLDEIPQLWNVLIGEMGFVGPRPERPEFVNWLADNIPYYNLRHIIRPGITGWAQVRYRYGASLEETREKVQYDLYYIKHMSLSLDLLITFETIKTILLRRGSQ